MSKLSQDSNFFKASMEAKLKLEQYTCNFLYQLMSKNQFGLQPSRRLVIFWRVADIIQTSLCDKKAISKRDSMKILKSLNKSIEPFTVYYSEHKVARSQKETDRAIKRLCFILSIPRHYLMVVAGPRGLLAGGLRIVFQNGTEIDIGKTSSGVSIPEAPYEIENIQTDAQFIMIVEKNSVFHHLTQHQFFDRFPKGILLSSSGYPSQAFSDFLVLLRVNCPEAPILFLVDADPYGVHIALCHLQSLQKEALSSLAFWIGISVEDVERVKYDATLSITARDRAKAQKLLQMLREASFRCV
ncbi:DNA topoisomerase VI subunit A isoform 2 [Galdieria sulphuraria]|uniref:DNA topoisomerase VI subunit A isoform 2 n=1 Tax=Galdieria sulphuraria TaxID=130081 RepID=M2X339_GALSU|nr:DNA topoisomerase VI subunit A isoform 2 [Galdieria sulphuraria]EME30795.1 DNA topoisomerase VI subunit A isoform 2 [Galdieria sulphuraria]|eukprot:XP_005707315.1 DNA topoisomerase VI subunit A isoform 2 [Galdieria sulphuraria]